MMHVGSLKVIRVALMLLLTGSSASAALAQTFTTYGGEATAVSGTVAGIPVNLAATGPIDPNGGERNNALVCYPGGPQCYVGVPDATSGLLSAQTLSATMVGRGDQSHAQSGVAKLSLLVHGVLIKADFVHSEVKSLCKDDGHGGRYSESRGRSEFSQLTIAGTPIAVSGLPNQLVNVPSPLGGTITVVINEQTVDNGYLTVRALHIQAPALVGLVNASDVSVAMAKAKTDCADVDKCFDAKITGGGFVVIEGAKITFAVSGSLRDGWGHLVAVDHSTGRKFKATSQTTQIFNDRSAIIEGFGEIDGDGELHPFTAHVRDVDEPGRNRDEFGLMVDGGTTFNVPFGTPISGGNIQFHGPKAGCPELPDPPVECPFPSVPDPENPGQCKLPEE
jgi:hypothetical protein